MPTLEDGQLDTTVVGTAIGAEPAMEVIIADLAVDAVLPEVGLHDDAAGEKLAIVAVVSKGTDATKVTGNRGGPSIWEVDI